ncbi:small vasohibin-binding protein isoform X1 [Aquila chrysaetos chrysaetos]|uniref:small vasohibin-binding protein isoform X1 n=1 Tax=Aquila chrysaetos chrysaetos TaxID=223781 RepID=UPI001176FE59|nr:small vasohibin-binding protein isoform X1 [Aquila chrysaetos chrysaetos]
MRAAHTPPPHPHPRRRHFCACAAGRAAARREGGAPPPSCPGHCPPWSPVGGGRKERPKPREPAARLEKAKQKSAQQELKQRQRAEIYALNRVMTELEQQQFDSFCKQMQASGE